MAKNYWPSNSFIISFIQLTSSFKVVSLYSAILFNCFTVLSLFQRACGQSTAWYTASHAVTSLPFITSSSTLDASAQYSFLFLFSLLLIENSTSGRYFSYLP